MKIIKMTARYVIGFKDGGHHIYENGELVYQGDRILFAGHGYEGPLDETQDMGNALIGPGFIDLDALSDLDSTVLAFDNQPGWKKGRLPASDWQRRETYSSDELDFNKRYAFTQLLLNGITTIAPITSILYREWAETADEFHRAADIAASLGVRAYLGPAYMSGYGVVNPDGSLDMRFDEQRGLKGLEEAVRFAEQLDQYGDTISGMLAPDRIEGCTPELLRQTADAMRTLDCPARLHSCQGQFELDMVHELHNGLSSVQLMAEYGLLDRRLLLPHLQYLGGKHSTPEKVQRDLALLGQAGVNAVICPIVAGRHSKFFHGVRQFQQAGINLSLGTDTFPPDMIQNMHMGTILSRVESNDITAASAADYYNMATLGGARALGRDDLGRLCAGAKADIMVFDFDSIYTGQNFDPITTMVLNGNGRDIKGVIINGEKVVWDRQLVKVNIDLQAMHHQAQQQFERFMTSYPERCYQHPPLQEIFPPSFPLSRP
ncbi:chlorohydrolase family protein [Oceanimonas sp. CHS3-5]|uniref:chlorohydrolase family protein n=1 Tax=Oceanimonas sp. CHS3-5 TaxID=3068186 RepID=UPI00273EE8F1|nr:chlorohydrolase family protein [Oceanimonas sp. CHS3-5]MDP5292514.1 chlorohydrolase family protein [Oceanimonas sp. CHS3-5]